MLPVRIPVRGAAWGSLILLGLSAGAHAATTEDIVRAWVGGLNSVPGWSATTDSITTDASSGATVVKGLNIASHAGAPMSLAVDELTLENFAINDAGGFSAEDISLKEAVMSAGPMRLVVDDVDLNGLSLPKPWSVVFDPDKPYTSIIKMYGAVASASLDHAEIGKVSVDQDIAGMASHVAYTDLTLDHLADGKINELSMGNLTATAPSLQGNLTYSIDSAEVQDMDLDAFDKVFDPDRYVNGVGDGVWVDAMPSVSYGSLTTDVGGSHVTVDSMTMEHFRLRQPAKPFAELFDALATHPDSSSPAMRQLLTDHIVDFLSSISLGRLAVSGMEIDAPGLDQLSIGDFHIQDFSLDGLGEIGVGQVRVVSRPEVDVTVDRFALGNIAFPSADLIQSSLIGSGNGNPTALAPHLGFVELLGGKANVRGMPPAMLDKGRLDLSSYVGAIPTVVALAIQGLDVDTTGIPDRDVRQVFNSTGLRNIHLDFSFNAAWRAATETVVVGQSLNVRNAGSVDASVELAGLKRSMLDQFPFLDSVFNQLTFTSAQIKFTDQSMLNRLIAFGAAQAGIKLTGIIVNLNPLTITAQAKMPVSVQRVLDTLNRRPERLPDMLSIQISGPTR